MIGARLRRPWTTATLAAAFAGGTAVAVATGIWAAAVLAPEPQSAAPRVAHAGRAVIAVSRDWERAAAPAGLAGLPAGRTAVLAPSAGPAARAVITFGPADGRSLLPRDLRALVGSPLPAPRDDSLGGRPAVTYRSLPAHDLVLHVTVLPSTAGMLAVACATPANSSYERSRCASAVASVSVPGAPLTPSPTIPLALRLPATIARLDRARIAGRATLSDARTPAAQADAARGLAARHLATARALRTAFGPESAPIAAALERSASGYAALGAAALEGSADRFADARRQTRLADADLTSAVDEVLRSAERPSTVTAPTARPAVVQPSTDSGWLRLVEVLLLTFVLLTSLVGGFMTSGRVGGAMTRAARRGSAPT